MSDSTQSYLNVQYDLRPAKQVERRMLVDGLQRLSRAGFSIGDYQYTGMGSFYFVDYILLHKLLGINDLWSAEKDITIEKRIRFNKPFSHVKIRMEPIGEVVPHLSPDIKHILWLDYDFVMCDTIVQDVQTAAGHLSPQSILLVTVDVEPPIRNSKNPRKWMRHFREQVGRYIPYGSGAKDFSLSNLPKMNALILSNAISAGTAPRKAEFIPLFNFVYADGHRMITIGGMIGGREERRKIEGSEIRFEQYYRSDLTAEPFEIRVPRVTRKERHYLDSAMPCADDWKPEEFEMPCEDIQAYRQIYRFFPSYAEIFV